MTREEAIAILDDNETVIENPNYLFTEIGEAWDMAIEALKEQRQHGEWVSKPKRVQVDETDEERIFETKLEWLCSSCGKSFDFRKPDDAFCKYCGSDNRKKEGETE